MGEFFGETPAPDDAVSRELVTDFETLSTDAQREVRDFVRFKKMLQEQERTDVNETREAPLVPDAEAEPEPTPEEEKP
jgi:hypothetical protein